ncbi:MAG TPA: 2-amino-4-hydroxy-6-hydroxymethyldihydropteridine diphosphokinase [Rhizomicrobium sp.]|jgi:2-amino-4-hydroxy-6-hydroxymethyldihydropteridine diphosphokinase|nr:2-amino-4-hydroxy-6-hydroxymethyldihydropteridine diphosphokinase [Rhizomicrobium sp.]
MTSNNPDVSNDPGAPALVAPVLISLGANIPSPAGTPARTLKAALAALAAAGIEIAAVSPFFETEAWPNPADPPFMNAVASVRTYLQPIALMTLLHQVETDLGRKRSIANAPRTLDLDLLDYAGQIHQGQVTLPHPRIAERRFVLEPLKAVAPDWRHPVSGRDVDALLNSL